MSWRVFRSTKDANEAIDHLETSGFDTSSVLSERIRLTAASNGRVLHSEHICIFGDQETGESSPYFDKLLLGKATNIAKPLYDAYDGWRDYRLGEILSGLHQVCQVCTPRSLSGALSTFMDFCHAILDAENLELRKERQPARALSSSFSMFMNLQRDNKSCSQDRILKARAIHEETVALQAPAFISRTLSLKSLSEMEKRLPLTSREANELSDLRLKLATNSETEPDIALYPMLSSELLLVRGELASASDIMFFKEMKPRSVAPLTVALASGYLSELATGGFFLPVMSCFSQDVVTTDPRAQVVANLKTSNARILCDLASAMMRVGGALKDPYVSVKNASLILGLEVNTA